MKIVQFWISAAVCAALSGCAGLVTMPKLEGCYPVDTLSVWEKTALHVGRGNPILLIDGKKFVCTCYQNRSLGKADEQGNLGKADEQGNLGKADEQGNLGKADEQGNLGKADEQGNLGKADEQGNLGKADEQGRIAEFSCRIVPECPGFQLVGYGAKEVTVLTPAGQKSVQPRCITW